MSEDRAASGGSAEGDASDGDRNDGGARRDDGDPVDGAARRRDEAVVREYLLSEHRPLLATVLACADGAAAADAGEASNETTAERFERALRDRGVVDALPDLLAGAVDALGATLPAAPVAAPPYVVVTRAGPVVRATLPDRGRLVCTVAAFERRDGAWVRTAETPEAALSVELR